MRTLPAQENASRLGGSYHQLMTVGPARLHATNPSTAPIASSSANLRPLDEGEAEDDAEEASAMTAESIGSRSRGGKTRAKKAQGSADSAALLSIWSRRCYDE